MITNMLFVYGSLRAGCPAHHLLLGCRFRGTVATRGRLVRLNGYPGLVSGDDWIHGELYELPAGPAGQRMLARLDAYEGVEAGLYCRKAVDVGGVTAWAYVVQGGTPGHQPDG